MLASTRSAPAEPSFGSRRPAAALATKLAVRILPLCAELLPGGRREGAEWIAGDLTRRPGRSLKVRLTGAKAGVWCDFATGQAGDALDLVAAVLDLGIAGAMRWSASWLGCPLRDFDKSVPVVRSRSPGAASPAARALWRESRPAFGTPAERYLMSRGIELAPPAALRFHPACPHPSGIRLSAMIAGVIAPDGSIGAVHRTFLEPGGAGKAEIEPVRAALGPCPGGVVRLAAADLRLGVAEGIETALSATIMFGIPAWATLGTAGLRRLVLPGLPLASEVTIFADGDEPGHRAADAAAGRWRAEGRGS